MPGYALGGDWPSILRRGATAFTVDGIEFTVAARTTGEWAAAIHSGDPEAVVPGFLPAEQWPAWTRLYWSDEAGLALALGLHDRIVNAVIGAAAGGIPWSGVLKILATAASQWRELDGRAADRGMDLLGLPLDRFCNLVLTRMLAGASEKDRWRIESEVFAPPPDADPDDPASVPPGWDAESEGAAFTAALAAHNASAGRR